MAGQQQLTPVAPLLTYMEENSLNGADINRLLGITIVTTWIKKGFMPFWMKATLKGLERSTKNDETDIFLVQVPIKKSVAFRAVIDSLGVMGTSVRLKD